MDQQVVWMATVALTLPIGVWSSGTFGQVGCMYWPYQKEKERLPTYNVLLYVLRIFADNSLEEEFVKSLLYVDALAECDISLATAGKQDLWRTHLQHLKRYVNDHESPNISKLRPPQANILLLPSWFQLADTPGPLHHPPRRCSQFKLGRALSLRGGGQNQTLPDQQQPLLFVRRRVGLAALCGRLQSL